MKKTSAGYFWGRSVKNAKNNKPMTVVSVSVLTVCLILLGTFVLISMNISMYLERLGEANVVRVYPPHDASQSEVMKLKQNLESFENVAEVGYVPKDEGAKEFAESYQGYGDILQGFEENPLPDKFVLTLEDISLTEETVLALQNLEGVKDVTWSSGATKSILTLQRVFQIGGGVVVAILALISAFIISNTIRASMHYRRLEIAIMRFVGAKNSFIRKPFLIEGFLIGLLGSVIAYAIEYFIYVYGLKRFIDSIDILTTMSFSEVALPLAGAFLLIGTLTGVIGSAISVRKHLKV